VIAKAEVIVTPIPPLTSDLPFITQLISLFHRVWPVAGLDELSRIRAFQVSQTGIFLGGCSFRDVEQRCPPVPTVARRDILFPLASFEFKSVPF
jgi:hypothetical protein